MPRKKIGVPPTGRIFLLTFLFIGLLRFARCIRQVDATPSDVNLRRKGGVAMGRGRLGLSALDKRDIWSRWKAGETLHEIGRVYGKCHNAIRAVWLPRGGIPPLARRRSRLALPFAERENISRGMASGSSLREIARCLHRATSTVSREVARHGGRLAYRAYDADQQAWNAALRPKCCLLAVNRELRDVVASKLMLDWSADRRVAESSGSRQPEHARVPRDDLSQPVHSSAGSAEKRAAGPSAL
jgi:hypothetical protein